MKLMHEKIDFPLQSAIKIKWQNKPHFTYPWHFHPEYEIIYVIQGTGNSFVANNIEHFQSGDLAMLGSNLPHFWRSDEKYHDDNSSENINYIVIQFSAELLHESHFKFAEFQVISDLLKRSARGIRFSGSFREKAGKKIVKIARSKGFRQLILLLELLFALGKTDQYHLLASESYKEQDQDFSNDRMARVLHYISTSYQQKIELEKVAGIAHLHPTAFCRFFKEKSGKSLSQYVNDMRIAYACRLIIEGKYSVSQVCFESGFNNLSNFNRTFKRQTGFTPTAYFKEFHNYNND
ncbi:MAG: AraC family transcriptional regulator [Bacteroidales bacterium]|nr:AraC family transcriptional regulator [Bacteroidales bacterium]